MECLVFTGVCNLLRCTASHTIALLDLAAAEQMSYQKNICTMHCNNFSSKATSGAGEWAGGSFFFSACYFDRLNMNKEQKEWVQVVLKYKLLPVNSKLLYCMYMCAEVNYKNRTVVIIKIERLESTEV